MTWQNKNKRKTQKFAFFSLSPGYPGIHQWKVHRACRKDWSIQTKKRAKNVSKQVYSFRMACSLFCIFSRIRSLIENWICFGLLLSTYTLVHNTDLSAVARSIADDLLRVTFWQTWFLQFSDDMALHPSHRQCPERHQQRRHRRQRGTTTGKWSLETFDPGQRKCVCVCVKSIRRCCTQHQPNWISDFI